MARAAVVNASPLIYLTEVAQLELLRLAGDEILVPRAVADEVRRWGGDDPAVRALGATPWLKIIETPVVPASVEAWNLGAGESRSSATRWPILACRRSWTTSRGGAAPSSITST